LRRETKMSITFELCGCSAPHVHGYFRNSKHPDMPIGPVHDQTSGSMIVRSLVQGELLTYAEGDEILRGEDFQALPATPLAEILGTLDIRPEELEEVLAGALGGRGPAVPQGLPPELAELVVSGNARVIEITPEQLAAMVGGRVPDELEALFDSAIGSAAAEPEDPLEALFSKPLEIK